MKGPLHHSVRDAAVVEDLVKGPKLLASRVEQVKRDLPLRLGMGLQQDVAVTLNPAGLLPEDDPSQLDDLGLPGGRSNEDQGDGLVEFERSRHRVLIRPRPRGGGVFARDDRVVGFGGGLHE